MGYSIRHEDKFIVKKRVDMENEERKVHHQIQKLRAEDSNLGIDIKEVLVNGKYRVLDASRPASPLGAKTHSSQSISSIQLTSMDSMAIASAVGVAYRD